MKPLITCLISQTDEFFRCHWNEQTIGSPAPSWSARYAFEGSLPNFDKQGVYAFVSDRDEVTYIGVGTSKGRARYRGHGLGKRFQADTRVVNGRHVPSDARLVAAGGMVTIGFEPAHAYLANALELFLISRLNPIHNSNKPGS